ncbi:hypothetical protein C4559_04815 [Candidatus Microgenomates bacterium]|nr:MAG: hypothetical protein C4559_04815 [Candidatus Microgenomates bacterium]
MKISLIGMSGTGKSHWAKKLEKNGFLRICCDDLIEEKLGEELKVFGYSGIKDVAKWMGQPYNKQYPITSKKYLSLEKKIMEEIINNLKNDFYKNKNIVIDTTGSVIYTGKRILQSLSELTKIIYLDVCDSLIKEMHKLYLRDPKPVIWGNIFKKKANETNKQALTNCYPKLLEYRAKKYKLFAKKTLDYFSLRKPNITSEKFLKLISKT